MGTNYYVRTPLGTNYYVRTPSCESACEHCDQSELVHLGKASIGWKFAFQAQTEWTKENALYMWIDLALSGKIEDEYGKELNAVQFFSFVMEKQTQKYCHLVYHDKNISGPDYGFWKKHTAQYDFHCGGFDFSYAEFT